MSDLIEMFTTSTLEDLEVIRGRIKALEDEARGLKVLEKALSIRLEPDAHQGNGKSPAVRKPARPEKKPRKDSLCRKILELVGDDSYALEFVADRLGTTTQGIRVCVARSSSYLMMDDQDRVMAVRDDEE